MFIFGSKDNNNPINIFDLFEDIFKYILTRRF